MATTCWNNLMAFLRHERRTSWCHCILRSDLEDSYDCHDCSIFHCVCIFLVSLSQIFTVFHCVVAFTIGEFQTKLIRKMLNIKRHEKVSNSHLHKIMKLASWSKAVKRPKLNWYDHLLRLPEKVPAKCLFL